MDFHVYAFCLDGLRLTAISECAQLLYVILTHRWRDDKSILWTVNIINNAHSIHTGVVMQELLSVALITILAVISPGADFAMVTRNSYLYGRKTGLMTALGIGLGVQIHVFYTMVGVGLLIASQPSLFEVLKLFGALYLMWVGYKTCVSPSILVDDLSRNRSVMSANQAVKIGVLTNALNPKTTLFVLSTYSQIVSPSTGLGLQYAYGLFMSVAHVLWFGWVALFFSSPFLRSKMLRQQQALNRLIGAVLVLLGGLLLVSPMW